MLDTEQKPRRPCLTLSFNLCLAMFSGPSFCADAHESELAVSRLQRILLPVDHGVMEGVLTGEERDLCSSPSHCTPVVVAFNMACYFLCV